MRFTLTPSGLGQCLVGCDIRLLVFPVDYNLKVSGIEFSFAALGLDMGGRANTKRHRTGSSCLHTLRYCPNHAEHLSVRALAQSQKPPQEPRNQSQGLRHQEDNAFLVPDLNSLCV